jgi:hypothetical protein
MKDEARRRQQPVSQQRLRLASWTILVTNAPRGLLSLPEALVLCRSRWQIELLFKLWKEQGKIDEWRTTKPERILCEVYAKLTAMVIQHWLLLVSVWALPDRSLTKAAQGLRLLLPNLMMAFAGVGDLVGVIEYISRTLGPACHITRRRKRPSNYQLLLELSNAY